VIPRWFPAVVVVSTTLLIGGCSHQVATQTGFVQVNGARLHYEEAGRGTPVVMIHGGFLDARMWDQQFEVVARRYRAIRYDVRAHGQSATDSVDFADNADLLALLDHLGVETAVIVGLSLGSQIAIDFTLTHPERVSALVLVSPGLSGFRFVSDEITAYRRELGPALESADLHRATEVFARWWCVGPHRQPEDVDSVVRARVMEMLAGSEQRWRYWNLAQGIDPPAADRLDEIRKPTLAVEGSLDMAIIHAVVDSIVARVPGARKIVVPGVAHMLNMEKPKQFNGVLLDFLRHVTPRPASDGTGGHA
jgi:3-oxoadipate enol-lactonase